MKVCAQGQLAGRRSLCWRLWLTSLAGIEVCLSLPRRWGVESNLSFGFFGVVESGLSVVVEPGLAGLL